MLIRADDQDLVQVRHLRARQDVMFNDWHAANGKKRLGNIQ